MIAMVNMIKMITMFNKMIIFITELTRTYEYQLLKIDLLWEYRDPIHGCREYSSK